MKALARSIPKLQSKHRAPRCMSLPPELWLAIFEGGNLSVKDTANARLTCSLFAALAKALAFSFFTFRVYLYRRETNPSTEQTLSFHYRRLEFWTSDSIAPFVRQCIVRPTSVWEFRDSAVPIGYTPDDFLRPLTRFVNLHSLECRHIPFSDLALSRLCQIRGIHTLVVDGCIITASAAPPRLKVTNIHFKSSVPLSSHTNDRGRLGWLDVLCPDYIRRVHFDFAHPRGGVADLRGIMTTRSPALRSGGEVNCMYHHLALIVSHPKMLEELVVEGWWGVKAGSPKSLIPLPSLRVYNGPSQILDWFTTGTDLHTLTLDRSEQADPDAVMLRFQYRFQPIQRLAIHIKRVSSAFIGAISSGCVNLKHLSIRAIWIDEEVVSSFRHPYPIFVSNCPRFR
jgi:hypothetical protein